MHQCVDCQCGRSQIGVDPIVVESGSVTDRVEVVEDVLQAPVRGLKHAEITGRGHLIQRHHHPGVTNVKVVAGEGVVAAVVLIPETVVRLECSLHPRRARSDSLFQF